jgi:Ca2+/H+ antiporter
MNKQLQYFFDNTKQLHTLLAIALLLIIIIIVAPIGNGFVKYGGQAIIITILIYILFKNFTETHHFGLVQKEMEKDQLKKQKQKKKNEEEEISSDTMLDLKNNTVASYVLCGFILVLLLYVIYSLFD